MSCWIICNIYFSPAGVGLLEVDDIGGQLCDLVPAGGDRSAVEAVCDSPERKNNYKTMLFSLQQHTTQYNFSHSKVFVNTYCPMK